MPAPSLTDLSVRACIKNIRSLTDVGSFEYWKIKPVLARIASPEQLHTIEQNSPQILGEDAELWQAFIARDIPNWKDKGYVPKNPTKWYEVYCKYKKEQRKEIERNEQELRQRMLNLQKERQSHVSKVVDLRTLPKVPKDPYMMANNGGVPLTKKNPWGKKEPNGILNFNSGSRTKLTDAKSVLTRARREAKEIGQMSKLSKPTHQLGGRIGQVKKAPAGMAKEYQIAAQPALKILSHRHVLPANEAAVRGPTLQEREARLKAAMSGTKRYASGDVKETLVGSSDDDSEVDDLFDEPAPKTNARTQPISSSRALPRSSQSGLVSSSPPRPKQVSSSPASSAFSRPKPTATSSPPPLTAASAGPSGPSIPTGSSSGPLKPMMPRKKKVVDVFNRDVKRPKLR